MHNCLRHLMSMLLVLLSTPCWGQGVFGTWKMNPARSQLSWTHPRAITVRIEPHAKGEVFTYERTKGNGQVFTLSVILYLDGKKRDWHYGDCSGTQFSRRLDRQTVEIGSDCENGASVRFIRRLLPNGHDLIMDQKETKPNGRGFERHWVLEKQASERE